MPFRPCVSGCGRYLAPGDGHDRCLSCLGIEHAEVAFVDESCSHCGGMTVRSSATCKGAGYLCLCRDLGFPLVAARGVLLRAVAGLVSRWQWGIPLQKDWGLLALNLEGRWSCQGNRPAPPREGGYPLVSFGAPPDDRMSIAASKGESNQSGDDVVAGSPGQGTEGPARGWSWSRSSQWASYRHGPRATSDESYGAVSGPCDVHHGGPGTPSLAVSGRHGGRQGTVPECPRVPDWPLRRRGGELRPAVLRCTEADWGNQAHPAPARSCCLHPAAPAQQTQQPPAKQCRGTGRRATAPPVQAPAKPGGKRRSKRPWDGRPRDGDDCSSGDGERTTPSPRGGLGGESFVSFFSATGLTVNGTQNLDKRAVSSISGSPQGMGGCERVNLESHSPSSLASEQLWAVREGDQSHYSRTLCRNTGKCITHADPASDRQRDTRGGSLRSPSLPHRGYVGEFVGATSTVLGGLASAFQPVSLAPPYHQTRLCDSVRPVTSQVSRRPLYLSEGSGCPHFASRDRSPTGKWRDRAGPSSQYEVRVLQPLPKKSVGLRPILDLCVLNRALHRLPFKMLTPKRIFGCVRPQDWFAAIDLKDAYFHVSILPRHRPFLRFVFEGRAYQYKVLPFGLSLSPRVFTKVAEGRAHSQLPRRLAYTSSVSGSVMRTQGLGALAPQPVGPSGQLGKEQTLPDAEDLISRYGVGFGQSDSAPHAGTRSVGVELLEYIQEQDGGTTETVSEAPGAYGGCGGGHAAGLLHMRPLQHWLHGRVPRGGVAEWHAAGPSHSSLPTNLHPVVRPFIPSGRSAPGTGLQARCGLHGCLRQGLGGHVQRACSVGGLDRSPTALAYQLPRVAGSTPGLEPSQETLTRRARTGPYRQHRDRCIHQPTRWSMLPPHVATRPPPPPLESEASEFASHHSYSGLAQPDSRRAVTSCAPRRVETPSPDGPADLVTFRTRTGRPVRVSRDIALPVVLLPDWRNTRHGRTGTQLAAGPSQVCISPSEPSRTDTVQGQGGRGADPARGTILALPDLVPRADAPRDSPSLADSPEEEASDSEMGHLMAPASRSLETSCLIPGRDREVLGDLPQEVVDTSLRREHHLRDMLTPWSGTCSSNGALLTEKTPGDARSESCCPSCSKGWSEGYLPPPSRSTWPWLLPTTTLWKGSRWGSMTGSSGSLGGQEGWILHAPPPPPLNHTLLGPVLSAQNTATGPVRAFADSRAQVPLNENSAPACTGLH